jgi:YegS/Rv2252/BmrU family lipid kinase
MDTDCLVLVNAKSGGGHPDGDAGDLAARFAAAGLRADLRVLEPEDDIGGLVRDALQRGVRLVVGGGGDGTINQVASALADSEARLGVLPLGTLNHFAKDLGLPLDVDEAIAVIAAGNTAPVDAAEVNDRLFLNNSGIGLYPDVVKERESQQRRLGRGKWLAFTWACVAALRRFPFLHVRVQAEGKTLEHRSAFVFVGNNCYEMEGLRIGERAALDQGRLSLYLSRDTGRLGLFALALRALFGRLAGAPGLASLAASELTIETHHAELDVSVDGEVQRMRTPLRYRSRPGALTVCVPVQRVRHDQPAPARAHPDAVPTPSDPIPDMVPAAASLDDALPAGG